MFFWAFFLSFVMATSFAVLNILVALVVTPMQDAAVNDEAFIKPKAAQTYQTGILARLAQIDARLGKNTPSEALDR